MVYEANGREYLAIYGGDHHFIEAPNSDQVIAQGVTAG